MAGTVASTAVVEFGLWALIPWLGIELQLAYCLVFGALILPTDPISVISVLAEPCPADSTKRSRSGHSGLFGLCLRKRAQHVGHGRRAERQAGWPLFAFWTMSTERKRRVLMHCWSSMSDMTGFRCRVSGVAAYRPPRRTRRAGPRGCSRRDERGDLGFGANSPGWTPR